MNKKITFLVALFTFFAAGNALAMHGIYEVLKRHDLGSGIEGKENFSYVLNGGRKPSEDDQSYGEVIGDDNDDPVTEDDNEIFEPVENPDVSDQKDRDRGELFRMAAQAYYGSNLVDKLAWIEELEITRQGLIARHKELKKRLRLGELVHEQERDEAIQERLSLGRRIRDLNAQIRQIYPTTSTSLPTVLGSLTLRQRARRGIPIPKTDKREWRKRWEPEFLFDPKMD